MGHLKIIQEFDKKKYYLMKVLETLSSKLSLIFDAIVFLMIKYVIIFVYNLYNDFISCLTQKKLLDKTIFNSLY